MSDVIEKTGILKTMDDDGNIYALYPHTKAGATSFDDSKVQLGVSTTQDAIEKIATNGAGVVELTMAEYAALGDEKKTNNITYYIKDGFDENSSSTIVTELSETIIPLTQITAAGDEFECNTPSENCDFVVLYLYDYSDRKSTIGSLVCPASTFASGYKYMNINDSSFKLTLNMDEKTVYNLGTSVASGYYIEAIGYSNGVQINAGGGATVVELTQAEYDALSEEEQKSGLYFIKDADSEVPSTVVVCSDGETVESKINGINESLTVDTTNLKEEYSLNALLQLLAEKYFINKKYLIQDGVLIEEFTQIVGSGSGTFVQSGDAMLFTANSSGQIQYNAPLDYTSYSTLKIEAQGVTTSSTSTSYGAIGVDSDMSYGIGDVVEISSTTKTVYTIDVSTLSGTQYFAIGGWSGMSFKIYNAWLE